MYIRKYKSEDCKEVVKLFYDTVHYVNIKDYSSEQVDAWASKTINLKMWDQSLKRNYSLVAIHKNIIVGFGDIDKTGYLDRLYVHKDYQGKGIASNLCDELEKFVYKKIITHASITAKPFFEKRGYKMIKKQCVVRKEIQLINYIMEK